MLCSNTDLLYLSYIPLCIFSRIQLLSLELRTRYIIAIVLLILFVVVIVISAVQIKNDKSKKLPYIQIVSAFILFAFLFISLINQISSYSKDLSLNSYVQYEGTAKIYTRKQLNFSGIPTGYTEYIVSFELNGEQIELYTRKEPDFIGDVENIFIVYANHSKHIINFEIVQ